MTNKKKLVILSIKLSLLIGFIVFILTQTTALYFYIGGFNMLETSLLSVIAGIYFFLVFNIIIYFKFSDVISVSKNKLYTLFIFFLSFTFYLLIDYIFFLFDNSIQIEYTIELENILKMGGKFNPNELDSFSKMPFALQNAISTFVFGLFGFLVSIFTAK